MSLRFREKQSLYHSLGQLLRSGVTFPAALESLARTSRGNLRQLLAQLTRAVAGGQTVGEAFASQGSTISELESGIVSAVERAGRLDRGLEQLAEYFGALETARAGAVKKAAYPIFVLHFGILMLGVKTLLLEGPGAYLREIGPVLAVVYGVALGLVLLVPILREAGAKSGALDSLLRLLPLIGSIRRDFAVSRFCSTYEMQLGAGVNIMDALTAAGRSSRSGLMSNAVDRALPDVRLGARVGPLLAVSGAFPEAMMRSLGVGEETGKLDEELDRLAAEHQRQAVATLDTLAEWAPRLIYICVLMYLGFRIVSWYQTDYLKPLDDLMNE